VAIFAPVVRLTIFACGSSIVDSLKFLWTVCISKI
jgi:hypothetical protein